MVLEGYKNPFKTGLNYFGTRYEALGLIVDKAYDDAYAKADVCIQRRL